MWCQQLVGIANQRRLARMLLVSSTMTRKMPQNAEFFNDSASHAYLAATILITSYIKHYFGLEQLHSSPVFSLPRHSLPLRVTFALLLADCLIQWSCASQHCLSWANLKVVQIQVHMIYSSYVGAHGHLPNAQLVCTCHLLFIGTMLPCLFLLKVSSPRPGCSCRTSTL